LAAYTTVTRADAEDILRLFSQDKIYDIGQLQGDPIPISKGMVNSLYRIETTRGDSALRIVEPEMNNALTSPLEIRHAFQKQCAEIGLKSISQAVGSIVKWHGKYIQIAKWIQGQELENITADQARMLGKAIAEFHVKATEAAKEVTLKPASQISFVKKEIAQSLKRMPQTGLIAERRFWESMMNAIGSYIRTQSEIRNKKLRNGVIHGDIHSGNILFSHDGNSVAGIIDYDLVREGPMVLDLLSALYNFAIQQNQSKQWEYHKDVARQLIEGYDSVIPLSRAEIRLYPICWNLLKN
jgi:Ser/Thr protein kinase RdoA (MazF antagonist)